MSLKAISSDSNVSENTHNFDNPSPILDPPPTVALNNPSLLNLIILTHHNNIILLLTPLHHYILLLPNTQFLKFHKLFFQSLSFPNVNTSQPQAHLHQKYLHTTLF